MSPLPKPVTPSGPQKPSDLPPFLDHLARDLRMRVRTGRRSALGFDIFFVDFSDWKLRFSDRTPVIYVSAADVASMDGRALAESLADVIRVENLAERNPVVLVEGDGAVLRAYFRANYLPAVVLDAGDQERVRTSRRPTAELLDCISPQLALALIAPYETSKPVTGSRFFGREYDIRRILYAGDANFAVMGLRRIGKTSLLREIERRLVEQVQEQEDRQATARVLYMDCSSIHTVQHFVQEVVRALNPRELVRLEHRHLPLYFPDFLGRMAKQHRGPLIFLLDEFDALLDAQLNSRGLLDELRSASNQGHCRFVIAGFRRVLEAFSDLNSPLYNFAKPLRLKEFSREETANLIFGPLEKLRVRFERRNEIADRIYDETGGQPNLIQYYCSILVQELDRTQSRVISPDMLFHVYDDPDFLTFVLNTFLDNTTNLEKAVVYGLLLAYGEEVREQRFTLDDIDGILKEHGIVATFDDLNKSVRNLELAGVLARQGKDFHFATPVFPDVLRSSYNVEFLLYKVQEEGVW
ncbi:MAG: ATP-binding protein [Caldilineae bacterium]|nr:MAG: ATP-binding protein [Caldilineae bacterium]